MPPVFLCSFIHVLEGLYRTIKDEQSVVSNGHSTEQHGETLQLEVSLSTRPQIIDYLLTDPKELLRHIFHILRTAGIWLSVLHHQHYIRLARLLEIYVRRIDIMFRPASPTVPTNIVNTLSMICAATRQLR